MGHGASNYLRKMLAAVALTILLFLAVPGQAFVPQIHMLFGAAVPLVPLLVFYTATAYPLPVALLAATGAGLFWDALWGCLMPGAEGPSIPLGFTMLVLGTLCAIYHLAVFDKAKRGLLSYCLLCAFGVLTLQMAEFLLVCLKSTSFEFPGTFLQGAAYQRMLWSSLLAMLGAPVVYGFFGLLRLGRSNSGEDQDRDELNSFAK